VLTFTHEVPDPSALALLFADAVCRRTRMVRVPPACASRRLAVIGRGPPQRVRMKGPGMLSPGPISAGELRHWWAIVDELRTA